MEYKVQSVRRERSFKEINELRVVSSSKRKSSECSVSVFNNNNNMYFCFQPPMLKHVREMIQNLVSAHYAMAGRWYRRLFQVISACKDFIETADHRIVEKEICPL